MVQCPLEYGENSLPSQPLPKPLLFMVSSSPVAYPISRLTRRCSLDVYVYIAETTAQEVSRSVTMHLLFTDFPLRREQCEQA